jgi:hypothetical protein
MAGKSEEAVVRTNLLLGAAAVGVLITGAIAQTSSGIERIKDAAGHSKSLSNADDARKGSASQTNQNAALPQPTAQPKKTVRTVYPNTQNAEQAVQQSQSAHGKADASKPGDVSPLSDTQQPANQANTASPAPAPQQNAQAPSPQSAPASTTQPSTPTPPAQTTQASTPAPAPSLQPVAAAPATHEAAPTATAQQSPSEPEASQRARQGSSGVVALDTQQQTSIGETIARRNVKPLTNVTFSMAVGTKLPTTVQLRALPSDLATFIPEYRGYSYVVVEEQMVIVDPGTQAIVAIVPYTASTVATHVAEPTPATHSVEMRTAKSREVTTTRRHPRPIAQKPMVTRSVNLNTEGKSETRHPATEQRKTTRRVSRREYREREPVAHEYRESAPRTVTIEEQDEPVYRQLAPRPHGFFDFFRGYDDDD